MSRRSGSKRAGLRTFHVAGTKLLKLRRGPGLHELVRTFREHSMPVAAPDARRAVELFREHTGVEADSIDGRELVGTCEGCGVPIFEGEWFGVTADECNLCRACAGVSGIVEDDDGSV